MLLTQRLGLILPPGSLLRTCHWGGPTDTDGPWQEGGRWDTQTLFTCNKCHFHLRHNSSPSAHFGLHTKGSATAEAPPGLCSCSNRALVCHLPTLTGRPQEAGELTFTTITCALLWSAHLLVHFPFFFHHNHLLRRDLHIWRNLNCESDTGHYILKFHTPEKRTQKLNKFFCHRARGYFH